MLNSSPSAELAVVAVRRQTLNSSPSRQMLNSSTDSPTSYTTSSDVLSWLSSSTYPLINGVTLPTRRRQPVPVAVGGSRSDTVGVLTHKSCGAFPRRQCRRGYMYSQLSVVQLCGVRDVAWVYHTFFHVIGYEWLGCVLNYMSCFVGHNSCTFTYTHECNGIRITVCFVSIYLMY